MLRAGNFIPEALTDTMSVGMITAASIGFGLLASLGLLVNGMPRRRILKAWPVTSALIFTALLSLTAFLHLVTIRSS